MMEDLVISPEKKISLMLKKNIYIKKYDRPVMLALHYFSV